MRTKTKKSPVVYWTSKWISTGKQETRSTLDNKAFKLEKRVLVGERNKNYKNYKRNA